MEENLRLLPRKNVFHPSKNCWRVQRAEHTRLIVDCADYYRALHESIVKARHSIFILGWEIDSHVRLLRGEEEKKSSYPTRALELLAWKATENPEINIYLCRWDASVIFVMDRELLPELAWSANTPENVHVYLDNKVPFCGSHHQKVVVIDDELVFTGGMDLARQRWDEKDHPIHHPERVDENGPYGPYHDVQVVLDGPVTQSFSELVRYRWRQAAGYEAVPARSDRPRSWNEPVPTWPKRFPPQVSKIDCAISRTFPEMGDQKPVQEIRKMYLDLISAAKEFIYIENQFLTAEEIAEALNRRLKEVPQLRVLIISSYNPKGIWERASMWAGRISFKEILEKEIHRDRVRLAYSKIVDEKSVACSKRIHAKVFIVDDKYLTVASSNLNHRSMAMDTECDVTFFGSDEDKRRWILDMRNSLLAEHTGRTTEEVEELFRQKAPMNLILNTGVTGKYGLYEVEDHLFTDKSLRPIADRFADPESPLLSYVTLTPSAPGKVEPVRNPRKHRLLLALIVGLLFVGLGSYAQSHPEWLSTEQITGFLERARDSRFALPLVCLAYIVGGFVLFPVTLMSIITAAVFGALLGPIYGLCGALSSAAIMFWLGHLAGLRGLRKLFGSRIQYIDKKFHRSGIIGVVVIRLLPIAPYTLVNLAAGISSIPFFDFIMGTLLGFLPGFIAKGFVGDSLLKTFVEPTPRSVSYLILGITLWLGLIMVSYRFAKRWQRTHTVSP